MSRGLEIQRCVQQVMDEMREEIKNAKQAAASQETNIIRNETPMSDSDADIVYSPSVHRASFFDDDTNERPSAVSLQDSRMSPSCCGSVEDGHEAMVKKAKADSEESVKVTLAIIDQTRALATGMAELFDKS